MLTYKRYKELKARRKELSGIITNCKTMIKVYQRIYAFELVGIVTLHRNKDLKELQYIDELLSMHKILWKQFLASQPKEFKLATKINSITSETCGNGCQVNCGNNWCITAES